MNIVVYCGSSSGIGDKYLENSVASAKKTTAKAAAKPASKRSAGRPKTTAAKSTAKKTAAKKTATKRTTAAKPATKRVSRRSASSGSNNDLIKAINALTKTLAPIAKVAEKLK